MACGQQFGNVAREKPTLTDRATVPMWRESAREMGKTDVLALQLSFTLRAVKKNDSNNQRERSLEIRMCNK